MTDKKSSRRAKERFSRNNQTPSRELSKSGLWGCYSYRSEVSTGNETVQYLRGPQPTRTRCGESERNDVELRTSPAPRHSSASISLVHHFHSPLTNHS